MTVRILTRTRLRILSVTALAAATVGTLPVARAADWTPKAPPAKYSPTAGPNAVRSQDYIPDVCSQTVVLDCVESVAAYINNAWVEGVRVGPVSDGPSVGSEWKIAGLRNANNSDSVFVFHYYNYTGNMFLTTRILAKMGVQDVTSLQSGVKFRAVIRSSWVIPTHTAGALSETRTVSERLATSGASRITVEGIPEVGTIVLDNSTLTSPTGKSSSETREFSVAVSDGRFYPIKQACVEKPTMTLGHDGYGVSMPKFEKGNLDLNITAPHFLSDGTTVNEGVYEAHIPIATASCLWGIEVTKKTEFGVLVLDSAGATKPAKTKVTITDDAVIVTARDFSYSAPTVRVNVIEPAVATTTIPPTTTTDVATTLAPVVVTPTMSSVRTTVAKRVIASVFTRVSGTTYKATAKKASSTKKLTCKSKGSKITCTSARLTPGTWTVSITPTSKGIAGKPYTKKVKVS